MKKTLFTSGILLLSVLVGAQVTNAIGTLTPSGTAGDDTQYTLNNIYNKLTAGTSVSVGSGAMIVPGSVSASFHTLTELYNAIPATLSLSASTTTVPVGINRATSTLVAIDSDLTAGNIATGVTLFGVVGTHEGAPEPLIWQDDPGLTSLCWDATTDQLNGGCEAANGLLDPVGDQSILLGAVEYCQYLDADGTTIRTTPQNVWHLPTIEEYAAITDFSTHNNATEIEGFAQGYYGQYWSGSESSSDPTTNAWIWTSFNGAIDSGDNKSTRRSVRCAK